MLELDEIACEKNKAKYENVLNHECLNWIIIVFKLIKIYDMIIYRYMVYRLNFGL